VSGPEGAAPRHEIRIYLRAGCHLCEQALTLIAPLAAAYGAGVEQVDIEADDRLLTRYLERIPVIELDGAELYDFFVDADDLRARLAQPAGR
jgi:hypothetical protein